MAGGNGRLGLQLPRNPVSEDQFPALPLAAVLRDLEKAFLARTDGYIETHASMGNGVLRTGSSGLCGRFRAACKFATQNSGVFALLV